MTSSSASFGQPPFKAAPIWLLAQNTGAGHYCRCRLLANLLVKETGGEVVIFWRSCMNLSHSTVRPMLEIPALVALAKDHRPDLVIGDGILTTKALAAIRIGVKSPTCLIVDYLRIDADASLDEVTLVQAGCSKILIASPKGWVRIPARYTGLVDRFQYCLPCVPQEILDLAKRGTSQVVSNEACPVVVVVGDHRIEADLARTALRVCSEGTIPCQVLFLAKPGTHLGSLPPEILRLTKATLSTADYAKVMADSSLVIGAAGINLITECLALRKRAILVAKPTADQVANGRMASNFGLRFLMNGVSELSSRLVCAVLNASSPDSVACDSGENIVDQALMLLEPERGQGNGDISSSQL